MSNMEVLHLDYRPGTASWALSLQSRLQESESELLRNRYSLWREVGLADLGGGVATRLLLILRVSYRLGQLIKKLRDEIDSSGEIHELLADDFVYSPKDARLFYDICVAVDAFYFELRSCYELVGKFVTTFGEKILGKSISEQEILQVLGEANLSTEWVEPLRANRILFFHETAPWIALQIHRREPLECSILVMKDNLQEFDDPDRYITQSQLAESAVEIQRAVWAIRDWLIQQICECEARKP